MDVVKLLVPTDSAVVPWNMSKKVGRLKMKFSGEQEPEGWAPHFAATKSPADVLMGL